MTLKRASSAFCMLSLVLASGCTTDRALVSEWSSKQEAIYQQCLEDSMAMAVAWEVIEQSCREQAETGRADTLQEFDN